MTRHTKKRTPDSDTTHSFPLFLEVRYADTMAQSEYKREEKLRQIEETRKQTVEKEKTSEIEVPEFNSSTVDFSTFSKCDFRAVKVKSCCNVEKSKKLLKFILDDGSTMERQILSGIAKYYKPEELIDKTLLAMVNLPSKNMMGLESNGMLLSTMHNEHGEEVVRLVMLDDSIPAGAKMC